MTRTVWAFISIAVIALAVGAAATSALLVGIPDSGSAPSILDEFNWSSTSNGFWHVYPYGATSQIAHGVLELKGDSVELDRRIQTDPYQTVTVARIQAISFHKFGMGLGIYHAGTIGLEFDDDGIKCGRGTDHGYQVDILKTWTPLTAPTRKWFYVEMDVTNPYPDEKQYEKVSKLDAKLLKPVTERCAIYDASGHLLAEDNAATPQPNTHYVGLDEAYMRTWDNHNDYKIDWFYAGPPAGNPLRQIVHGRA